MKRCPLMGIQQCIFVTRDTYNCSHQIQKLIPILYCIVSEAGFTRVQISYDVRLTVLQKDNF